MKLLLALVVIVAAGFVLDRLLLKAEVRGWIYWRRRKGSHGMPASAALEVHQLLEPSKKYILEVQREQDPAADRDSDPPAGGGSRGTKAHRD
jgi:hypothetical protein